MGCGKKILFHAVVFMVLSAVFPNMFYVSGFMGALIAATVYALLNATIRPILMLLSLPITLITFGLFRFVINTVMLLLMDGLVSSVWFRSFGDTLLIAILLAVIASVVEERCSN